MADQPTKTKPHVPSPQAIRAINQHGQKWGIVLPKSMHVFIPDNRWIAKNALEAALDVKAHHKAGHILGGAALLLGSFGVVITAGLLAPAGTVALAYAGLAAAIGMTVVGASHMLKSYERLQKETLPLLQDNLKNRFMNYVVAEAQKNRVRVIPKPVEEKAAEIKTKARSAWGAMSAAFQRGRSENKSTAPKAPAATKSTQGQKS
jgi:hypothetical protein